MNKDDIIKDYIKYLRYMSILSDEDLINIMDRWIETDQEHIDILEKLLYDKEKIRLTALTFAQSTKFKEGGSRPVETEINICVENGCLSTDELKKLAQCIREIEQNNTDRIIKILMKTPEKTIDEMKDVLGSVTPGFPTKMIIKSPLDKDKEDYNDLTKF